MSQIEHKLPFKGIFILEKLTYVNFGYFMYPIAILQYLEKIIKVDQQIQGCIIFGRIGQGYFLGGKLTIVNFVTLWCPVIMKSLN